MGILTDLATQGLLVNDELELVNKMLLAIGEMPLAPTTLTKDLPLGTDAAIARDILRDQAVLFLSHGWFFNTDYSKVLNPDVNHFISLPPTILGVDFNGPGKRRYDVRQGLVFDVLNDSFKIHHTVTCDTINLIDYEYFPLEAINYLVAISSRIFQSKVIGSDSVTQMLLKEEGDAFKALHRRDTKEGNYAIRPDFLTHTGYLTRR